MSKGKWLMIMVSALLMVMLVSGLTMAADVKITLLNSKGEIQSQLEETAELYVEQTEGVDMEVIPCAAGQSPYEKVVSMYASGNAPTIAMLDPGDLERFESKALDLSSEKWVEDTIAGSMGPATLDDERIIGFPFTVEGYGLIYNKAVINKAVDNFDPADVNTRKDLEQIFESIEQETEAAPMVLSPMDWSLAGHFLPLAYTAQGKDWEEVNQFFQDLRDGKAGVQQNDKFRGLVATLDLLKEYNIDKNDPLAGTYDRGPDLLGNDEVGFWFMGNWAWPNIAEFDDSKDKYGFLPVPVSNDPDEYGNSQIPVGVTKYFIVDKDQSSEEEIAAARDFLNWLVYEEAGQKAVVKEAKVIPAFENIEMQPDDPLARSIQDYVARDKTLLFMTTLPPDHWSELGASMQKYVGDHIGREELLAEIEDYWKNLD